MKKGFTLAEVLITLGIIGVVAAMTLPAVINKVQNKQRSAALKKAYSTLQQALVMYQKDYGDKPRPADFPKAGSFKVALLPYFAAGKDCGKGTEASACYTYYEDNTIQKYKNYEGSLLFFAGALNDGQFILNDGMMYFFENNGSSNMYIFVDINGMYAKPNQAGRDLFGFQFMDSGKLIPLGAEGTAFKESTHCKHSSSKLGENGVGCTFKALKGENY